MNQLVKRIVTALSTAAIVTMAFVYMPLSWLYPVLLVLSCLCQAEFYIMAKKRYPVAPYAGTLMGIAWLSFIFMFPMFSLGKNAPAWSMMFFSGVFFIFSVYVLLSKRMTQPITTIGTTFLGFLYIPFLLSFFLRIVQLDYDGKLGMPDTRHGLMVLLFVIAVVKLQDMGGFAFGKAFGKHKMCPTISPKKSWEGLAGGVLGSVLMASLFCWIAQKYNWGDDCTFWRNFTYVRAAVAGVLLAFAGTLGDLVESRFKRECDIKDSATFMPAGLGGFLDMFDSILFAPALFYPYLYWCLVTEPLKLG